MITHFISFRCCQQWNTQSPCELYTWTFREWLCSCRDSGFRSGQRSSAGPRVSGAESWKSTSRRGYGAELNPFPVVSFDPHQNTADLLPIWPRPFREFYTGQEETRRSCLWGSTDPNKSHHSATKTLTEFIGYKVFVWMKLCHHLYSDLDEWCTAFYMETHFTPFDV